MNKKQKKEQKQKALGLPVDPQIPVVLVSEVNENLKQVLSEIMDAVAALGVQVLVLDPEMKSWEEKYPHVFRVVEKADCEDEYIDIELLDELTSNKQNELFEHKRVPIADKGTIQDFDPIAETGNGFSYKSGNPWSLLVALVRAAETYRFPYDWKNVIKAVKG